MYLQYALGGVLTEALVDLCKIKPKDPISYLGNYLLQHNPNAPKVTEVGE